MRPEASPLQILDFAITELQFKFVPPQDIEEDVSGYFQKYQVDIDFSVNKAEFLSVFIKADINKEQKLPGYSLFAEAGCFFRFNEETNLPEETKKSLADFSTIYIALNSLRGLISNFTANAPFGRYILPSIDLNDLIEKKKKTLMKTKKVKRSSTTGPKRKAR